MSTSSSSYHNAAICYADNNNVDNAATYNDHRRGRRSPGIDSNILGETTPLRDMEDTEAYVLTLTSDLGTDTTGGPPVLEDGSGRLGGRLSVSGLHTTGEEEGAAGESAGNTPYPNAAILFNESEDEDLDIQCGRCENPLAYCHCDNSDILIIPPPIITTIDTIVTTTQDSEETALPQPKKKRTTPLWWRYVSDEDFARRQTREEEFRSIAAECTHLGPCSAQHIVPYPPLPMDSSATKD
jgi:hypothetical protein